MSSTNRGAIRNNNDFYHTPEETIRTFWKAFSEEEKVDINDMSLILDPCAGGDIDRECPYPKVLREFISESDDQIADSAFWTVDIREDSRANYKKDFFLMPFIANNWDMIISNPPFSLFEQFVKKSIELVKHGCYVIFLLRINVLGGQDRNYERNFWTIYKPKYLFTHAFRPFGDSCEYAHFVWQKGWSGKTSLITGFETDLAASKGIIKNQLALF